MSHYCSLGLFNAHNNEIEFLVETKLVEQNFELFAFKLWLQRKMHLFSVNVNYVNTDKITLVAAVSRNSCTRCN